MDDYLKVVIPHLKPELVTPDALSHIRTLAQILPPFATALFECRLGSDQSRVDFQVNFSYLSPSLPETFLTHSAWQVFQEINQERTELKSYVYQRVKDIWLEFDLDKHLSEVPVPCIFLAINEQTVCNSQEVIEIASKLLQHPVSSSFESNLRLIIDCLPVRAEISHIGAMLSRSAQAVRINIRKIDPEQVLDYLMQIGWTDSSNTLQLLLSDLSKFVDYVRLTCDVGDTISPQIGLECFLQKQPKNELRWQLFLDYLVEKGLCTPAKQNALLAWPGLSQKASQPDIWPHNLNSGDMLLGSRAFSIFGRTLNHLKIVYKPDSLLEAKAYLAFFHDWFDADLLNRGNLQISKDYSEQLVC
ncbi:hypothetical protein BZZ01_03575 [Nostocales cyanobacterium HT-58-2]|nr:hypothetical protein BZZ01_03575 [Nostocales cyanobacterium HT-58-2]